MNYGWIRVGIVRKAEPAGSLQRGFIQLDGSSALSAISRKFRLRRNFSHGRKPSRSSFRNGRLRLGLFVATASIASLFRRLHSFMVSPRFRNSSAIPQFISNSAMHPQSVNSFLCYRNLMRWLRKIWFFSKFRNSGIHPQLISIRNQSTRFLVTTIRCVDYVKLGFS